MSGKERDLQRVLRLQAGDERALEELYDRYTPLLYSVVVRILGTRGEAESALQEAWLQVWRRASTYDPRRGTVAAWLLTVARTQALERYRSGASSRRDEEPVDPEVESTSMDPAVAPIHEQLTKRVRAALSTLDPRQRQVIEIAYFEGLSQTEIVERVKAPLGAVKSWTRQGLMRLGEMFPREEWA